MVKKSDKYNHDHIKYLYQSGFSDKEIADKLGHRTPEAWRQVQKIRRRNGWLRSRGKATKALVQEHLQVFDNVKDGDLAGFSELDPKERVKVLKQKFDKSARFRYMFGTLDPEEIDIFQSEYFQLVHTIKDLTLSEEQPLFMAVYELVLALRAQKQRKDEEEILKKCRKGEILQNDPRFIVSVSDKYDREYNTHMQHYQKLIESLKLSRKQRLEKVIQQKKSFIDYAVELSSEDAQKDVASTVTKLEKKSDKELKRLIDKGLLLGYFGALDDGKKP